MTSWTGCLCLFAAAALLPAQSAPKFEVASVKLSTGCVAAGRSDGGRDAASPGTLDLRCHTVMYAIRMAYGRDLAISGGPAWIDSERYDIVAKAETAQSQEVIEGPMLQTLLADRFRLKVHRETKEVPVYALTVGKGGAKLQPAQPGKCTARGAPRQPGLFPCGVFAPSPAKDGSYLYSTTLAYFCGQLSVLMDRQVVDKTGIEGVFDVFIEAPPGPPAESAPDDRSLTGRLGGSILGALQRMGLKLESAKGPKEFLAIDRVERPSEN
jgi:uncharacterized protein (TIGR03435 family)